MNTQDYLDQAKVALSVPSDYALAGKLGISRTYLSTLRVGKKCLSDELAVQIAKIINVPPALVLADAHVEREMNPDIKAAYIDLAAIVKKGVALGFDVLVDLAVGKRIKAA